MDNQITREQKIEWLKNLSADELLKQYDKSKTRADIALEYANRAGFAPEVEEIVNDYMFTRAEVLRRIG